MTLGDLRYLRAYIMTLFGGSIRNVHLTSDGSEVKLVVTFTPSANEKLNREAWDIIGIGREVLETMNDAYKTGER